MAEGDGETGRNAFQEHVVEPARRAGEAVKQSGQRAAQNGAAIGSRLIDQAEANAQQAFAAMRAAAQARDLAEVMKIQGDFLRQQGTRSMDQAREIGELIMRFGREAVAPMRADGDGS